jgi:hypothetical protein
VPAGRPRRLVAVALGAAGLVLYNWWAAVALLGWLPSVDSLFSEVSAQGQPHDVLLQRLDVTAGVLLLGAFVARGRLRPVRPWVTAVWVGLLVWAFGAAVGGVLTFACAPTTVAGCRYAERHLQLPLHHYLHMLTGVTEFAGATTAIVAARWVAGLAPLGRALTVVLAVAYPLLGLAYLGEHLGALVEPVFFTSFSVMAAAYLLARDGEAPSPARAQ